MPICSNCKPPTTGSRNIARRRFLAFIALSTGTFFGSVGSGDSPQNTGVDVLTNRYNIERTGANLHEAVLNVNNVNSNDFGKIFEREVDGDIYAQPLIKAQVNIPDVGLRDVVYVATENNSLYAFDASSPERNRPYWHLTSDVFGDAVPKSRVTDLAPPHEYLNFDTTIGITAAPVIDEKTNTIYVVAQSMRGGTAHFRLHAFDLGTGREKTEMNSPREIEAVCGGNGIGSKDGLIRFDPRKALNRPGLLLVKDVVYAAFSTHLDGEPSLDAHGWVMAYDASMLKQMSAWSTTPDGLQGGIWQSGTGLAADTSNKNRTFIYAVAGNGSVGGRNASQSILQLFPGAALSLKQLFTPADQAYQNDRDLDLSAGPVLLPDLPLVVACSKEGKCYVVNRATMRLVQEFQAGVNSYGGERVPNIHGAPVVWRTPEHRLRLYVWSEEDFLRAYEFDGQIFHPAGKGPLRAPERSMPGGMLSLSANDSKGGAIVWASLPLSGDANAGTTPGVVRAFDAINIGHELWNSEMVPARDRLGFFAKFCPPVIANGKVYVATFAGKDKPNKLIVYGPLSH